MKIHTLRCEMVVSKSVAETFSVFEDPHNLAKITPSWLNFRVTTPGRIEMRKGTEINYRIKWVGVPINWKTLITQYEPPFLFVDEQVKGPYSLWRHRHTFKPASDGTLVGDQVEYSLPLGPVGELAHGVVVRRQLLGIFRFRQEELKKLFGGTTRQVTEPTIDG
jgi:ligand-binding SRPBCC domain-containing protein